MKTLLLISDSKKVFEITNSIVDEKYNLIWYTYKKFEKIQCVKANVIIMYFNENRVKNDNFPLIVRVQNKLGKTVPILALIEKSSIQEIFSIINIGVFDYLDNIENKKKYEKKIEEALRWNWYLEKYTDYERII